MLKLFGFDKSHCIYLTLLQYLTFFGGLVEKKESLTAALKRELNEEISYIPKNIENAAFNWKFTYQSGQAYTPILGYYLEDMPDSPYTLVYYRLPLLI